MRARNPPRHFPYKHPTFGTKQRPKPKSAWEGSVYYWWWAYLKRNRDYLDCCEKNGEGKLAALYRDFGDVRGDDFKTWWTESERGARLFAEPSAEESVRILKEGDPVPNSEMALTVAFPLNLPKTFLVNRLKEILSGPIHGGRRGYQLAKRSQAKYRVQGQPNIPALKKTLMVYDELMLNAQRAKKKPYWKVAIDLGIIEPKGLLQPTDHPSDAALKRNVMAAIVGRLKLRASRSIKNAAAGRFP